MSTPLRAPARSWRREAGLVLRSASGSEHQLNTVAGLIWEACDGTRSRAGIATYVASQFDRPLAEVAADVNRVVATLADQDLVTLGHGSRLETALVVRAVSAALGLHVEARRDGSSQPDLDWDDVVQIGRRHAVIPLLARGLPKLKGVSVPPTIDNRLSADAEAMACRSRELAGELVAIVALFDERRIRAFSLKGPATAAAAYGEVGLRAPGDLDIFVPAERVDEACALLEARGYVFEPPSEHELHAARPHRDAPIAVDLQWMLAPARFRFPLTLADLTGRLEPVPFCGGTIWQPPLADQLMFLCAHGAKHCWHRLQWIADVAAIVQRRGARLDWDSALEQATRAGAERQVLLGLLLAQQQLGAPLPAAAGARLLRHHDVRATVSVVGEGLFERSRRHDGFQGAFGVYRGGMLYARTRERVRDRPPLLRHLAWRPVARSLALLKSALSAGF